MTTQHLLREWNGKSIRQRADGYICLTDMANAVDKRLKHWNENAGTASYIETLSRSVGIPPDRLIEVLVEVPNDQKGTWGHRRVAIRFAQWCSDAFAVQVDAWVEELIVTGSVTRHDSPMPDINAAMMADLMKQLLTVMDKKSDRPLMHRELDDPEMRLRSIRKEYEDAVTTMRMAGEHVPGAERSVHLFYQAKIKQLSQGDVLDLPDDVWVDVMIKGKQRTAVNLTRFQRQLAGYTYIASREAAAIFDQKDLWAPMQFTTTSARNMLTKAGWLQVADTNSKVPGKRKQSGCHDHYWMRQTDIHLLRGFTLEPIDLDILRIAHEVMVQEATCCSVSTQAVQIAWNTSHLGKSIYLTGQRVGRSLHRLGFTPHKRDSGRDQDSFWDFPTDS